MASFTPQASIGAIVSSSRTEILSTERRFQGLKFRIMVAVMCIASLFSLSSCEDNAARIEQIDERLAQIEDELASQRVIYWGAPVVGGAISGATGLADGGSVAATALSAAYEADAKIKALKRERTRLQEKRQRLSR